MTRPIAAVGATLTACGLFFLAPTGVVASAATAQTAQANAALRYLYTQVGSDGSVGGAMGATEDTVISDADSGYDPATLRNATSGKSAYDFLSARASTITTAGGAAKYLLAWFAAGQPAALQPSASVLLTRLNALTTAGGYLEADGTFHNASSTVETANAYSQSLAVLADVAAGSSQVPTAQETRWLVCAQRPDGGFGYAIDETKTPPAFCGDSSSDTNDTGVILQALGQVGISSADGAAKTYLHSAQQTTGGFGFGSSGPADPDSDAGVVQALVAIGEDPGGSAWTVTGGRTPLADMESFADPHGSGGYVFPGSTGPDAFTTSAIPQALVLDPYAAATTVDPGTSPPAAPARAASTSPAAVPVPPTGAPGTGGAPALLLLGLGTLLVGAASRRGREPTAR